MISDCSCSLMVFSSPETHYPSSNQKQYLCQYAKNLALIHHSNLKCFVAYFGHRKNTSKSSDTWNHPPGQTWLPLLDLCVSSLRRSQANLLCIVPILTDDPRKESKGFSTSVRASKPVSVIDRANKHRRCSKAPFSASLTIS